MPVPHRTRTAASIIVRALAATLCVASPAWSAKQPMNHAGASSSPAMPSAGDAAAGRQVFRVCGACHSLEPGRTLVGPSLAGLIGRQSGTVEGFDYSTAMKQAHIIWGPRTLDAYLTDPQKVVPGNRMPFPGLQSALDRRDVIAFLETAAKPGAGQSASGHRAAGALTNAPAQPSARREEEGKPHPMPDMPDVKYTLRTGISEGRMVFLGVGGEIDGKVNPLLSAAQGQIVQVTLINGEGAEHDIFLPDQNVHSARVVGKGASTTVSFLVNKTGDFIYYCTVPGHRLAGMQGEFIVSARPPAQTLAEADISREPTDIPPPITRHEPQLVRVDLIAEEVSGRLASGSTYLYWTFNGRVPGPFIRVRVGDTIEVHLKNSPTSSMVHSVDFHAVIGPGGGASVMQVDPGKEKTFRFKALVPGLFVYHCATPMVAEHIANGMYGLILVEPASGLPPVDREFYVMQGEIYTEAPFGQQGSQEFSVEKLLAEHPEYFVFNGSVGALSKLHPLHAKVGDTIRIFFGNGGPNFTSSFHLIGEIFDRVYPYGGLLSPPLMGIQTVSVPPGGATMVELKTHEPGAYSIVDHALSRVERGLGGILYVECPENPDIFTSAGGGSH